MLFLLVLSIEPKRRKDGLGDEDKKRWSGGRRKRSRMGKSWRSRGRRGKEGRGDRQRQAKACQFLQKSHTHTHTQRR